jgi:hypothetical protein
LPEPTVAPELEPEPLTPEPLAPLEPWAEPEPSLEDEPCVPPEVWLEPELWPEPEVCPLLEPAWSGPVDEEHAHDNASEETSATRENGFMVVSEWREEFLRPDDSDFIGTFHRIEQA